MTRDRPDVEHRLLALGSAVRCVIDRDPDERHLDRLFFDLERGRGRWRTRLVVSALVLLPTAALGAGVSWSLAQRAPRPVGQEADRPRSFGPARPPSPPFEPRGTAPSASACVEETLGPATLVAQRTRPVSVLRDAPGMVVSLPDAGYEPLLSLLASGGVRRVGIDLPWNLVSFDEPAQLRPATRAKYISWSRAIAGRAMRVSAAIFGGPGSDAPARRTNVRLLAAAPEGARRIALDPASVGALVAGRSGLPSADGRARVGELFTAIGADGVVDLARPLSRDLRAGTTSASVLRFAPFERPRLPDGAPNPVFEETLRGWLDYVQAACRTIVEGTGGAGYDLELHDAGAVFFDRTSMDHPAAGRGPGSAAHEIRHAIVARTADWLRRPESGCGPVRLLDGLSTPGTDETPPGIDARAHRIGLHAHEVLEASPGGSLRRQRAAFPEIPLVEALDARGVVGEDGLLPIAVTSFNLNPLKLTPRFLDLSREAIWRFRAKVLLRTLTAFVGRGAVGVDFYRVGEPAVTMVDAAAPGGGEPLRSLARALAAVGEATDRPVDRELVLQTVRGCAGNGAARMPDRVAFFPFQRSARAFVAATYLLTNDLLRPGREDGPSEQWVVLDLGGIEPDVARARFYDPIADAEIPVERLPGEGLRLLVPLTDAPRLLFLDEQERR
jgi:hypothetical protein